VLFSSPRVTRMQEPVARAPRAFRACARSLTRGQGARAQDMKKRGRYGHVINVSSMSGHRVPPGAGAFYAATKHALRALTEGLRQEARAARAPPVPGAAGRAQGVPGWLTVRWRRRALPCAAAGRPGGALRWLRGGARLADERAVWPPGGRWPAASSHAMADVLPCLTLSTPCSPAARARAGARAGRRPARDRHLARHGGDRVCGGGRIRRRADRRGQVPRVPLPAGDPARPAARRPAIFAAC
jgi:hypothetical protein